MAEALKKSKLKNKIGNKIKKVGTTAIDNITGRKFIKKGINKLKKRKGGRV